VRLSTRSDVHRAFGFGYREYIYSLAMERDLIAKGFRVDREVGVMVYYRGEPLAPQTIDMIVEEKVIVENKAVERLPADTPSQLFSYLCSTDLEVGLAWISTDQS
jgi:GxxExxY protein